MPRRKNIKNQKTKVKEDKEKKPNILFFRLRGMKDILFDEHVVFIHGYSYIGTRSRFCYRINGGLSFGGVHSFIEIKPKIILI